MTMNRLRGEKPNHNAIIIAPNFCGIYCKIFVYFVIEHVISIIKHCIRVYTHVRDQGIFITTVKIHKKFKPIKFGAIQCVLGICLLIVENTHKLYHEVNVSMEFSHQGPKARGCVYHNRDRHRVI